MYKILIRPVLFLLPPERVHSWAMGTLVALCKLPGGKWLIGRIFDCKPHQPVEIAGLRFKNRVGLAAGFDKDGKYIEVLAALGFGFIEVGTVTPRPQRGNPRPRLFRLLKSRGLINRMGFNNDGCDALATRLSMVRVPGVVIGGNIGKNKDTPNADAVEDYAYCFNALFEYVDYFTINVSSPNTPGLRALQSRVPLTRLLQHLQELNHLKQAPKPIFLKVAPDLTREDVHDIVEIAIETGLTGIVATNTTISRKGLEEDAQKVENMGSGGLSGAPLTKTSTDMISAIRQLAGDKLVIIGVGGIFTARDAREKLKAGASLIQVYTGFIYEGPAIVKRLIRINAE